MPFIDASALTGACVSFASRHMPVAILPGSVRQQRQGHGLVQAPHRRVQGEGRALRVCQLSWCLQGAAGRAHGPAMLQGREGLANCRLTTGQVLEAHLTSGGAHNLQMGQCLGQCSADVPPRVLAVSTDVTSQLRRCLQVWPEGGGAGTAFVLLSTQMGT